MSDEHDRVKGTSARARYEKCGWGMRGDGEKGQAGGRSHRARAADSPQRRSSAPAPGCRGACPRRCPPRAPAARATARTAGGPARVAAAAPAR